MANESRCGVQGESLLALDNVSKSYGAVKALGPINFEVRKGEFLTLLGPSGCGKTTTLQIIAGLLTPTAGRVRLSGSDITDLPPRKRDMGVVFQSYALFPHKTVRQNVAFGLRMRKLPAAEIESRVTAILDIVGLSAFGDRLPHRLSGGQRQRVALARSLVIEPRILLLDEPLSNLDAQLRKRMRVELRDLQQRLGITTILVTHDQDEAFELSDRVIVLNQGRIEQIGSPQTLYDAPATRFVAEFIGEANLIAGRVMSLCESGRPLVEIAGDIELVAQFDRDSVRVGEPVLLFMRPERIGLSAERPDHPCSFEARITRQVFSGETLSFDVETKGGVSLTCVKPSLPHYRDFGVGRSVWLVPDHCRALPL